MCVGFGDVRWERAAYREAVVPAAVRDLLADVLLRAVLPVVPVQVVGVDVGLGGGEAHAARVALDARVQLGHHAVMPPVRVNTRQTVNPNRSYSSSTWQLTEISGKTNSLLTDYFTAIKCNSQFTKMFSVTTEKSHITIAVGVFLFLKHPTATGVN